jgi:hypothetical protein
MQLVDIEDSGTAVRCPAHGRIVDVQSGHECVLAEGASCPRRVGAPVQRTHTAWFDAADGRVKIRLSDAPSLASDVYNAANYQDQRAIAAAQPATISFACRKARAVAAVTAKRARVTSSADAEPQLSPGTRWRQQTLFDFPRAVTTASAPLATEEAVALDDAED